LSADAYVAKGPLAVVATNLLMAIKYLEDRGRGDLGGGIFGYEGFRSRRLISEMLVLKRYWEALLRAFDHGMLGLDEEGRILLANPAATRLLGKKEVRLVGESVTALTAGSDRQAMQETLSKIKKARLPEDHRLDVAFGKRQLRVRLSGIVEDGACAGILMILEPQGVEPGGAVGTDRDRDRDRDRG
jgi:PAS domain S-box-containing protein